MSLSTFKDMVSSFLDRPNIQHLTILFHGGEPTLLSIDWYDSAIQYALDLAQQRNKTLSFSMQSNFVSISNDFFSLLNRWNIRVGVSIDNVDQLPESMRPNAQRVVRNFKQARQHGVKAYVLSTINPANYSKFDAYCDWLNTDLQISVFKANVAYPVGFGQSMAVSLSPQKLFQAQTQILDYIIRTKAKSVIELNLSDEIIRYVENGPKSYSVCDGQRCGAGESVLGVTPKGDLLPCGRFAWNSKSYFIGKIDNATATVSADLVNDFHAQAPENWSSCDTCSAKPICTYGCQAFILRSKEKKNIECTPTQMRFAFYTKNHQSLLEIYPTIKSRLFHQKELTRKYKNALSKEQILELGEMLAVHSLQQMETQWH